VTLYCGTARIRRPGDPAPPGARVTEDLAEALAASWRDAETSHRTPFVYEAADGLVVTDVFTSPEAAWRATQIHQTS
jgi:hypothetical protein